MPQAAPPSILVIDDDEFVRISVSMLLRSLGCPNVRGAGNAGEALEYLRSSEPCDLVLCDINVPGAVGLELVEQIARLRHGIHFAALSGAGAAAIEAMSTVAKASGLKVVGALGKPFTERDLVALLGRMGFTPPAVRPQGQSEVGAPTANGLDTPE